PVRIDCRKTLGLCEKWRTGADCIAENRSAPFTHCANTETAAMRLRSHSAARRSLNGRGEVSLPLLIALTCGLICRGAAAQSLDPDWTLPNSASATPSAEARDAPLMRDYVAEVLATPPGG